jgi:predicted RNA-binding Zn ribbon-like protein
MGRPPAKPASEWRDGFLFLGNQAALDFLNTRPLQGGRFQELLPHFRALLRWLRAADLLGARPAAALQRRWDGTSRARSAVRAARLLRERVRNGVVAWERSGRVPAALLRGLNRLLARHPLHARLKPGQAAPLVELFHEPRQPEDLLAALAYSAALLFAQADAKRARKCAGCVLRFLDTSKKGTRRWCSMRLCGNRAKVAAYAARRRAASR